MARFGGWAQFGGHSRLGGAPPIYQRLYRVAKGILVPGFWPDDDDLAVNRVLRGECKLLAQPMVHAARLASEVLPSTAAECLPDWEELLGIVPAADATLLERRDSVIACWRAQQGISLPELRAMLYPLLQPATAFLDHFDGGTGSLSRWALEGNGTRALASSDLTLTLTSPTDGDWLAGDANLCTYRLHDIDDGWTWLASMTGATLGTDTAAGIVAMSDVDNAVMLVAGDAGGSPLLRVDQVVEGVLTVGVATAAVPSWPCALRIVRSAAGLLTFMYDATTLHTMAQPVRKLTRVGLFARNLTASTNTVSGAWEYAQLVHDTPENNVEIVEQSKANCDLAGDATLIFEAHVIRRPTDSGAYDISAAQHLCDRVKQGHTLLLVGETDALLCDDAYSLCDRDLLGE